LDRAKKYLKKEKISHPAFRNQYVCNNDANLKIDLVIWFHTELYRDKLYNTDTELAHYIYNKFSDFFKELGAKTAVVGGAGDIHDCFNDYITADFFIKSWRQQILKNADTPTSNGIIKVLNSMDLPIDDKINIIDNEMQLIDLVSNSRFFPDGCHPGTEPHYELVKQLSKTFNL
jgi:hypothetical protein